jgi:hypothetical protein
VVDLVVGRRVPTGVVAARGGVHGGACLRGADGDLVVRGGGGGGGVALPLLLLLLLLVMLLLFVRRRRLLKRVRSHGGRGAGGGGGLEGEERAEARVHVSAQDGDFLLENFGAVVVLHADGL